MDRWLKTGNLSIKRKCELKEGADKRIKETGGEISTTIIVENRPSTDESLVNKNVEQISNLEKISEFEIWNDSQLFSFKNKYAWLICSNGKLGCRVCTNVKTLNVSKHAAGRISLEWSNSLIEATGKDRQSKLSNIRIKIKKHNESEAHASAENTFKESQKNQLLECLNTMNIVAEDENIKLFRTAYYIAKKNRPFSDYEDLINLQQTNGVNLGKILHSRYSATNIINHIACQMRINLISKILSLDSKFSILIDESTTLSNKSTLIIYLKANLGEENIEYVFLDLCELESQDSENVEKQLLETLHMHGLHEEYLKKNWIAIATDGANVMVGKHSGVVARLKRKYPRLFAWHCLNHRLELSVGDAIKDVRGINHFKSFMDKLYSLYSQSPKNCRALQDTCHELGLKFAKVGRILGIRWVASSFRTIKAVWESYESLWHHFKTFADLDSGSTYQGLKKRFESPGFVLDLGLMYDVLQELSLLSSELQSRSTTLPRAEHLIKRTIRIIESFKTSPGEKRLIASEAVQNLNFKNIYLVPNLKVIPIDRNQFLQSIIDRMKSRLCTESDNANEQLLKDISALHAKNINSENVRYGELEMKRICKRFDLDEFICIQGLRDFADDVQIVPEKFKTYSTTISTLPCSTAECERGFSLMNNIITVLRTSLLVSNVSNLMFISANGPPVEQFDPIKYVRSWLLKHRSSIDTRSRVCSATSNADLSRQTLWDIFR